MRSRLALAGLALVLIALAAIVWRVAQGDGDSKRAPSVIAESPAGATSGSASRAPTAARIQPLRGSLHLEGQVIDEDEHPVAGATVWIATSPSRSTISEADGSFAFDELPAATFRVDAVRGHDLSPLVLVRVRADTEPVILRLRPGNMIAVKVVDAETNRAIAGARVRAGYVESRSGTDGLAVLDGLPIWFTSIVVSADGYAPAHRYTTLPDDPAGRFEISVALSPAARISGTVVDPDGHLIADANVMAGKNDDVRSDQDGAWTLWVPRGAYKVLAGARGFATSEPVSITSDASTPQRGIVLHLSRGQMVTGHVVDEAGRPVDGAIVASSWGYDDTLSDADGAFLLKGLEPGRDEIWAHRGDLASEMTEISDTAAPPVDLRLRLADGTILGTVVDSNGAPVGEAQVLAFGEGNGNDGISDEGGQFALGPMSSGDYQLRALWPGSRMQDSTSGERLRPVKAHTGSVGVVVSLPATGTITGAVTHHGAPVVTYAVELSHASWIVRAADGHFIREHVPVGTYYITIAGDGFARDVVKHVVVTEGDVTDLGAIEVTDGETISGRVVDGDGAPVANANVMVADFLSTTDLDGENVEHPLVQRLDGTSVATTGSDGRFAIAAVARESMPLYAIAVTSRGRSRQVTVPENGETVLVVAGVGTIEGRFDGVGSLDLVFAVPDDGGEGIEGAIDGDHFEIRALAPGHYRVGGQDQALRRTTVVDVEVRTGEVASVVLGAAQGGTTLVVHRGKAPCNMVYLMKAGPIQDPINPGGKCTGNDVELPHVEPGDYDLCVDDRCNPVTVAASPDRQTVDVTGW